MDNGIISCTLRDTWNRAATESEWRASMESNQCQCDHYNTLLCRCWPPCLCHVITIVIVDTVLAQSIDSIVLEIKFGDPIKGDNG